MKAQRDVILGLWSLRRIARFTIPLLCLVLLCLGSASTLPDASAASVSLRLPAEFRTWKIHQSGLPDLRISTWSVPWISTLTLSPRTTFVLSGQGRATTLSRPDQNLGDVSEIAAQFRHQFSAVPLTGIASISAPGTQSDVSAEDWEIRQWLSHPLLAAGDERWGRGIDVAVAAIWAPALGNHARGAIGTGIEVPGSYRVGEVENFRPGAEYSLSLGVEWQSGGPAEDRVLLRFTGRTFGRDKLDGAAGFREGDQVDAAFRWNRRMGPSRLSSTAQASWKGDGERSDPDLFEVSSPGWLGAADLSWMYVGGPLQAGLQGEARRLDGSRSDPRYGWSLAVGPVLSGGSHLRLRAEALYQRSRWEEGRADATGTLIRLTLGYLP